MFDFTYKKTKFPSFIFLDVVYPQTKPIPEPLTSKKIKTSINNNNNNNNNPLSFFNLYQLYIPNFMTQKID